MGILEVQSNHRFQVNLQRRIYGHATDVEIRPLNEEKAVQAASDFLGEAFIFSVIIKPSCLPAELLVCVPRPPEHYKLV